jgi:hypothetical protein
MQSPVTPLPDPPERPQLEPYATVYLEVIAPEAAVGDWFASGQQAPEEDLKRISRRIEAVNERLFGHAVHPAIYIHALLVCGHFFYQAAVAAEDSASWEDGPTARADAAFSLVHSLKLHHNVYDLYLLLA